MSVASAFSSLWLILTVFCADHFDIPWYFIFVYIKVKLVFKYSKFSHSHCLCSEFLLFVVANLDYIYSIYIQYIYIQYVFFFLVRCSVYL